MTAAAEKQARFIELPENQLAARAVQRLARGSGGMLATIHGPAGTGKSLLARWLLRRITGTASPRSVRLMSARELPGESSAELRALDLLIIDDLQYLPAHAAELLNLVLDERGRRRRGTLLLANAAPNRLRRLPHRTLDRIAGGLVAAIEPYGPKSRRRILERHARQRGTVLDADALDWLAARPGGVRQMLGTLAALAADSRGKHITLGDAQAAAAGDRAGVDRIVRRVAETFGVKVKEVLGQSRLRSVLLPRHVAMYLARELASLPLPRIGEHFGRDQSSVQHAVEKVRLAITADRELAGTVRQLKLELA